MGEKRIAPRGPVRAWLKDEPLRHMYALTYAMARLDFRKEYLVRLDLAYMSGKYASDAVTETAYPGNVICGLMSAADAAAGRGEQYEEFRTRLVDEHGFGIILLVDPDDADWEDDEE